MSAKCSWNSSYQKVYVHKIWPNRESFHCLKSVQKRSFYWPLFSCIWTEFRKIRTRKKSAFGHFSRSVPSTKVSSFEVVIIFSVTKFYRYFWKIISSIFCFLKLLARLGSLNFLINKTMHENLWTFFSVR